MTTLQVFKLVRKKFMENENVLKLVGLDMTINISALSTEEILGTAERKDFPILEGKEIIQQADFGNGKGQSFTSQPSEISLTIGELLKLPLDSIRNQGIFIAGINAVMNHLGLISNTVHCKDEGPECCAKTAANILKDSLGDVKLALIGYQPCLFANLSTVFSKMRITDLSSDKIGTEHYGITVEDGTEKQNEVCEWADVILCTGSTLTNGTFPYFYELALCGKNIMFYGTTISGTANLLGLKRLCFADTSGNN